MREKVSSYNLNNLEVPLIQYLLNEDFQVENFLSEKNGFCRFRPKFHKSGSTREMLRTLLSTNVDIDDSAKSRFIDRVIQEKLDFGDLASLSHEDLEILGIKDAVSRDELLNFFRQLPNQSINYHDVCRSKESVESNTQIIKCITKHFLLMRASLAALNYKLQILPAEDVIVDEKSYATYFVNETLKELIGLTHNAHKQMLSLKLVTPENAVKVKSTQSTQRYFIMGCSAFCVGILLAIYYGKLRNNI